MDNFVHADLHPGNILVQGAEHFNDTLKVQTSMVDLFDTLILEVQPSYSPLRLVLLDAGIIAELQSHDLENFRAVFTAVVLGQVRPSTFWHPKEKIHGPIIAYILYYRSTGLSPDMLWVWDSWL